jgi:LysR family nitrogen assimilation transcriptional regulator
MEYSDILAFLAVVRSESYSRAADKLHLAQSALSRRVRRLEQDLGVSLLERHPRGVRPTEAGRLLMLRAEKVDIELRQIEQDMRALGHSLPEDISVAMPHGAARLFITPVVARFQGRYPKVKLHIFERESVYNQESALRGKVDFALVYCAQPNEELSLTPLLFERVLVIGPASASVERRYPESYDVSELARLPLILPGRSHGYRHVIDRAIGRQGLSANIILEVNGFATSLTMVQQGLGYTISTYPPVQSGIEAGLFVGIPIKSADCEVKLSLVHRADRPMAPTLNTLKTIIQEVSASIETSPHCRPA